MTSATTTTGRKKRNGNSQPKEESAPKPFLEASPSKAEKFEAVDLYRMELAQTKIELAAAKQQFTAERIKATQLESALNVMRLSAQKSQETQEVTTATKEWSALVLDIEERYNLRLGEITYNDVDGTITHRE